MLQLKPSPIHGIGVFALIDFKKGDKVVYQYSKPVINTLTEQELLSLPKPVRDTILDKTIFLAGEKLSFLDIYSTTDFRSYMNHSETPNTDGIYALRDITAGEEVTEDYRTMGEPHSLTREHMPFVWN